MYKYLLALGVCLPLFGCASAYSSIRQTNEDTYVVTKVKRTPFSMSSTVLQCKHQGSVMNCGELASP